MVPEMEKARMTEIMVRMDCTGCVQNIKNALHGITGIYDLYIDFPQQKITTVGWAEPEKIVKAIKKTRKGATICSHSQQPAQETQPDTETKPEGPPPESASAQTENPPEEAVPPKESQPLIDNPPAEEKPATEPTNQSSEPPKPKHLEEIHVIYHNPPHHGYQYAYGHGFRGKPYQPVHMTHSYNTYKPLPYVTEYAYLHSPPPYMYNTRPDHSQVYYSGNDNDNGNGNIASMFSEENPNACRIV